MNFQVSYARDLRYSVVFTTMDASRSDWQMHQGRIYLSFSSQCESSVMRVSFEGRHKKPIIMHIRFYNPYSLRSLDQEADIVWVNLNNAYSCL